MALAPIDAPVGAALAANPPIRYTCRSHCIRDFVDCLNHKKDCLILHVHKKIYEQHIYVKEHNKIDETQPKIGSR